MEEVCEKSDEPVQFQIQAPLLHGHCMCSSGPVASCLHVRSVILLIPGALEHEGQQEGRLVECDSGVRAPAVFARALALDSVLSGAA